ncbi:MAG: hypothetical protein RBR89_06470 [Candidatus Bipolaricaulis sp.]|nr:hypothetical protein [Candidatus Bipolaricaulis sp.]
MTVQHAEYVVFNSCCHQIIKKLIVMLAKRKMTCSELKKIDLLDFLAMFGFKPSKFNENVAWYYSPLNINEKNPSFRVNQNLQLWYDYSLGVGGDVIKLGCLLFNCSIKELLLKMDSHSFSFSQQPNIRNSEKVQDKSPIEILNVKPITHEALLQYIKSRSIEVELAKRYCVEIRYQNRDKIYFGIGFKSESGFEIRSKYFQGCSGKGVTFLNNNSKSCTVIEGFFSWLSLLMINPEIEFTHNHLILNSTSNFVNAMQYFSQHEQLFLYPDLDKPGLTVVQKIEEMGLNFKDESSFYRGYSDVKDLNDFLIYTKSKK